MTQPDQNDSVQGSETPTVTPETNAPTEQQSYQGVAEPSGTDGGSSQESDLYAPYLEKFPSSLHPIARDVFKEWDGNVTKRLQAVHSEYEPYKPFVEQYEPDALAAAVQLAEALENDPETFLEALNKAYGGTPQQQGQEFVEPQVPDVNYGDEPLTPEQIRLDQQEQLLRAVAERMLSEEQAREQAQLQAQEDALYEQTMNSLTEKYGEFDTAYVNSLLAQGVEPEAAVQHWRLQVEAFAQQQLAPNREAPIVMGAGGGTPSVQRDVENLSSQDTRKLVEQMLEKAAREGR